jgi:hypothetical protein
MKKIRAISPPVDEHAAVFWGDTPWLQPLLRQVLELGAWRQPEFNQKMAVT